MTNFLRVSEAPKTKLQLKKAILNGSILVFEIDTNRETKYRKLENVNIIINLWSGFMYSAKYQGENQQVTAYLGTSYFYKFAKVQN